MPSRRPVAPCPFCAATSARLCPYHSDDPSRLRDFHSEVKRLTAQVAALRGALTAIAENWWSNLCADAAAEEMRDQARAALAACEQGKE